MKENGRDGNRTDKSDKKQPEVIETRRRGAPIGEFVFYQCAWHHPSHHYASGERPDGQEIIARQRVAEVEEVHATQTNVGAALRQRAQHGNDTADSVREGNTLIV